VRKVLSVILLVVLFAVPCWAAETEENISMEKGEDNEAAQAIANLALAEQLAELGRAQRSPLLLASAAQILNNAGTFTEEEMEREQEGSETAEGTKEAATSIGNTPASLFAEAIAVANERGDVAFAAILESESRVGGTRGVVGGARFNITTVWSRDTYNFRFQAGRLATIRVVGDGDDIELYVYDANGNLIARDAAGFSTVRSVSWTPSWTGNFRVVVRNPGNFGVPWVAYRIDTN
jgi:hypothetical protein